MSTLRKRNRQIVKSYYTNNATFEDIVNAVLEGGLYSRTDNFKIGRAFSNEGRADVLNDRKFVGVLVLATLVEDGKITF